MCKMKANQFMSDKRGDMNMVNAGIFLVVLLVVLYVGVNIIQNVSDASSLAATDSMYQTMSDLDNTTEDAYGMAAIMPIVMIAVAVLAGLLGILYLFR